MIKSQSDITGSHQSSATSNMALCGIAMEILPTLIMSSRMEFLAFLIDRQFSKYKYALSPCQVWS